MAKKKIRKETQNPEIRAEKNDEKLEPKEQKKKHKAENGEVGDSVTKEKEFLLPNIGGYLNTYIVPIAFVLSITALVVSIIFAMSSKSVKQDGEKLEEQQLQLTKKLESSRAKMESAFQRLENLESSRVKMESAFPRLENLESSRVKMESAFPRLENLESSLVKMESAFQKLENIESKIADFDINEKTERGKRALIELKKALLSFQEVRSLIDDDEAVRIILDIEDVVRSSLVLPEEKETEVENKEAERKKTGEIEIEIIDVSEINKPE